MPDYQTLLADYLIQDILLTNLNQMEHLDWQVLLITNNGKMGVPIHQLIITLVSMQVIRILYMEVVLLFSLKV